MLTEDTLNKLFLLLAHFSRLTLSIAVPIVIIDNLNLHFFIVVLCLACQVAPRILSSSGLNEWHLSLEMKLVQKQLSFILRLAIYHV